LWLFVHPKCGCVADVPYLQRPLLIETSVETGASAAGMDEGVKLGETYLEHEVPKRN
jgi:hypothetical protein